MDKSKNIGFSRFWAAFLREMVVHDVLAMDVSATQGADDEERSTLTILSDLKRDGFARISMDVASKRAHESLMMEANRFFAKDEAAKRALGTDEGYGGMRVVGYASNAKREEFEVRMRGDKVSPTSSLDDAVRNVWSGYERLMRSTLQSIEKELSLSPGVILGKTTAKNDRPCTPHSVRICKYKKVSESKSVVCPAHTDVGLVTIIPYALVPGLEVWGADKKWVRVEEMSSDGRIGDAVLIVGDSLEYITRSAIRATPHRVVHKDGLRVSASFHAYALPDAEFSIGRTAADFYRQKRDRNTIIRKVYNQSNQSDITSRLKQFLVL